MQPERRRKAPEVRKQSQEIRSNLPAPRKLRQEKVEEVRRTWKPSRKRTLRRKQGLR